MIDRSPKKPPLCASSGKFSVFYNKRAQKKSQKTHRSGAPALSESTNQPHRSSQSGDTTATFGESVPGIASAQSDHSNCYQKTAVWVGKISFRSLPEQIRCTPFSFPAILGVSELASTDIPSIGSSCCHLKKREKGILTDCVGCRQTCACCAERPQNGMVSSATAQNQTLRAARI